MMTLSVRMQAQLMQALQLCGGMTQSIFPQAEAWLLASIEHQAALEYVAMNKNMNRYESVMDFLFCEIFPIYRSACQRFYAGRGPQLRDMINVEQLVFSGNCLMKALELAFDCYQQKQRISWCAFKSTVLRAAA
ncbi:MAG: hypothetical protein A3B31_01445 [Candidatus Komeilibacteria bacterium RIFCSPLOWO2_01_FULL_53_11]|uniref:Uncharacterized protein n=1 Tax=Candidatus Komeilibacteria bacterium RIFCSPLOWO2_01_FULL_53_11 TaxID=1798552 RepID=A0A1G2BRN4_9BACT|nr:MAG: hypothetical protein A3B31_01445 [Candidatus Komeilibacteria bacterium RIFCSPLOWO2_01_FULL_53_11]